MTAASQRGARLEVAASRILRTKRVKRRHFGERAPDAELVRLPSGELLQIECKSRKVIPRVVRLALEQARGYSPGAIPCSVVRQRGHRAAIIALSLEDFARLVGLKMDDGQLALALPRGER